MFVACKSRQVNRRFPALPFTLRAIEDEQAPAITLPVRRLGTSQRCQLSGGPSGRFRGEAPRASRRAAASLRYPQQRRLQYGLLFPCLCGLRFTESFGRAMARCLAPYSLSGSQSFPPAARQCCPAFCTQGGRGERWGKEVRSHNCEVHNPATNPGLKSHRQQAQST